MKHLRILFSAIGVLIAFTCQAQHEFPYNVLADTIIEYTLDQGVLIEGVLLKDGTVDGISLIGDSSYIKMQIDTIVELTPNNGVSIEGVTLKDGMIEGISLISDSVFITAQADTVYVNDTDTKLYGDGSNNLVFEDIITGAKTLAELINEASALLSVTACLYNDTTYISIGDTTDIGLNFTYSATRDMTTSVSQSGSLIINYDTITNEVSYSSSYVGSDIGLDIQSIRLNDVLKLMLIVDNTNTNSLNFNLYSTANSTLDTTYTSDTDKVVSYTTCTYNDTSYITIGTTSDVGYRIHYVAERNTGTVKKASGMIDILYDDIADTVFYYSDRIGFDLGLTIEADKSGLNIRLMIIVDNSITNDLLFDDKIISKFYE